METQKGLKNSETSEPDVNVFIKDKGNGEPQIQSDDEFHDCEDEETDSNTTTTTASTTAPVADTGADQDGVNSGSNGSISEPEPEPDAKRKAKPKELLEEFENLSLEDVHMSTRPTVEDGDGGDGDTDTEQEKDEDQDKEVFKDVDPILLDDFVDEDFMKEEETTLNEEQLKERFENAKELKDEGNEEYKAEKFENSIKCYTRALQKCPLCEKEFRAILYGNRAAAKIKFGAKEGAVMDCTKSLEYNPTYMKSLVRRSQLYEELDKLDEALEDYKKIFEMDPSNKEAFYATQRLPPVIHERNEKLKTEMMGKLKDLGNLVLRPFGLSTSNFQLQPTETGGYTINFKQ